MLPYWIIKENEQNRLTDCLSNNNYRELLENIEKISNLSAEIKNQVIDYCHYRLNSINHFKINSADKLLTALTYFENHHYNEAFTEFQNTQDYYHHEIKKWGIKPGSQKYLYYYSIISFAEAKKAAIYMYRGDYINANKANNLAISQKYNKKESISDVFRAANIEILIKITEKMARQKINQNYSWLKKINAYHKYNFENIRAESGEVTTAFKKNSLATIINYYQENLNAFDLDFPAQIKLSQLSQFLNYRQINQYLEQAIKAHSQKILQNYKDLVVRAQCINDLIDFKYAVANTPQAMMKLNKSIEKLSFNKITDNVIAGKCYEEMARLNDMFLRKTAFKKYNLICKSLEYYNKALAKMPDYYKLLYTLGVNNELIKNYELAAYYYYEYYRIKPTSKLCFKKLFNLYRKHGIKEIKGTNIKLYDIINNK